MTAEQKDIAELNSDGDLLVRGQAGSGKTTVLLARAGHILSVMNGGKILFLTYNAALCANVERSLEKVGMSQDVTVNTFHEWARSAHEAMIGSMGKPVDQKERSEILKEIISARDEDHRLLELEAYAGLIAWWSDEIAWIFGQRITDAEDYSEVERVGRGSGVRLSREDRSLVWQVFLDYTDWLEANQRSDYDDPAGGILNAIGKGEELPDEFRYEHVLVDEVQDFDKAWLLAAAQAASVSMTLAGDVAQKIYKRNFTWASVGIQVRGGRSRRLSTSHRTTQEIMKVAKSVIDVEDIRRHPDYTEPAEPARLGEPVRYIVEDTAKAAYNAGYDYCKERFGRLRSKSIVVAVPFAKQTFPAQKALEARGLYAKSVRGRGLGSKDTGIFVTTYHQLKGLEFDHVVLLGLHDAQFPGRFLEMIDLSDRQDEEATMRKLLYMAMTRAKESLTLVGSGLLCRFLSGPEGYIAPTIHDGPDMIRPVLLPTLGR